MSRTALAVRRSRSPAYWSKRRGGLGVEAIRRMPPQDRGLAMGAYTVFLDVALGFGTPALGLLANFAGLGTVFLVSAVAALSAALIAASFLRPFAGATAACNPISR
jgi:predicted MFS family arabinose efflux permease